MRKFCFFVLLFSSINIISLIAQWQRIDNIENPPNNFNYIFTARNDTIYLNEGYDLFCSTNNGENWKNIFPVPNSNGYIGQIIFHENLFFLEYLPFGSTRHELYLSADFGNTWNKINDTLYKNEKDQILPLDMYNMCLVDTFLYVGTNLEGLYKYNIIDSSWKYIPIISTQPNPEDARGEQSHVYFINGTIYETSSFDANDNIVHFSKDKGLTWGKIQINNANYQWATFSNINPFYQNTILMNSANQNLNQFPFYIYY